MESMLIPIAMSVMSGLIQQGFSRSDFDYTHSKTNIPAQVDEMRQAGLNPALAYGQVSAPQGQSLGNYQADFAQMSKDIANIPMVKQQIATSKAEEDYYKALAFKTQNDGQISLFNSLHQEEMFNLEKEYKGLVNSGYQYDNSHRLLMNDYQRIQNGIARIDWASRPQQIQSQLNQVFAETFLMFTNADATRQKLPFELRLLKAQTMDFLSHVNVNKTQAAVNKAHSFTLMSERGYYEQLVKNLQSTKEGEDLTNSYMKWLSNNGSNWQRYRGYKIRDMIIESLGNLVPSFNFGMYRSMGPVGKHNPVGFKR